MKFRTISKNIFVFMNILLMPVIFLSADSDEGFPSRDILDTLSLDLNDTVGINMYPGDIIMEIFQAPTDLTLNQVGINIGNWNTDGQTSKLRVEIFKQDTSSYPYRSDGTNYPFEQAGQSSWLGYAHSESDESTPYPDLNDPDIQNLVWSDFSSGTGPCNALTEQSHGQPIFGDRMLPSGDDSVLIETPNDLSSGMYFVDFTDQGGANFLKDEYIAIAITYVESSGDDTGEGSLVTVNGSRSSYWHYGQYMHPAPGLKYFSSSCSGPSGEHGWYVNENTASLKYVVNVTGVVPPKIEILQVGLNSLDPLPQYIPPYSEVLIVVRVNDAIEDLLEDVQVVLHWQVNSPDATENVRLMSTLFNLVEQEYHFGKRIDAYGNSTRVYWWISATDGDGNQATTVKRSYGIGTLDIGHEPAPHSFRILGNYPNPFNPETNIILSVDKESTLNLKIHSLSGALVREMFLGRFQSGTYSFNWDGKDQLSNSVPSGVYIYRFEAGLYSQVGKMTLLK